MIMTGALAPAGIGAITILPRGIARATDSNGGFESTNNRSVLPADLAVAADRQAGALRSG